MTTRNNLDMAKAPIWYKQFWPWFLIALPLAAVIASVGTVIFAFKHADPVVEDNYYKQGLAINRQVHDLNNAKAFGLSAEMTLTDKHLQIQLSATDATFEAPSQLKVYFRHPLDDKQDTDIALLHAGNGLYRANSPNLAQSMWHIDVQGSDTATKKTWRLKQRIAYPQESISLQPAK